LIRVLIAKRFRYGTENPTAPSGPKRCRAVDQSIVDSMRGLHERYVFTYADCKGNRDRLYTMLTTGWKAARRRAAKRYMDTFGREAPFGFRNLRVHDLRHTLEDREDLLGHK
jgi:hypothetical protein